MSLERYLLWMGLYYLITIAVETAILLAGLSPRHPLKRRLFAGAWLTACTYPVVWLALPEWIDTTMERALYYWVAEIFAPAAECCLFWLAFGQTGPPSPKLFLRDMTTIIVANLGSFGVGLLLQGKF